MRLESGNVLDSQADALLLTIDGAKKGMEGNLVRQFDRRWHDDWDLIQRDIPYPLPLGRTIAIEWDGDCSWHWLLIASTLNHSDTFSDLEKIAVVRSAFHEALNHCHRLRLKSLATTIMRGGWRLTAEQAFGAMLSAWHANPAKSDGLDIQIFVMNDVERDSMTMMLPKTLRN